MEEKCVHFIIDKNKVGLSALKHNSAVTNYGNECGVTKQPELQNSFPVSVSCWACKCSASKLRVKNIKSLPHIKNEQIVIRPKLEKERHRLQHCEIMNHQLRSKLTGEKQKLSAAIAVQKDMSLAVQQLQSALDLYFQELEVLEEYEDGLSKNFGSCRGDCRHHSIHCNDSTKVKYPSHDVLENDCNDIFYPPEKENFRDCTNRKEQQHIMTQMKNKFICKKTDSDVRIKQLKQEAQMKGHFIDARKKFKTVIEQYEAFKTELFVLKENREAISSKLEEVNRKIDILKQYQISLLATLDEMNQKEKCIYYEMRELSSYIDRINLEIKTYVAEHIHNKVRDSGRNQLYHIPILYKGHDKIQSGQMDDSLIIENCICLPTIGAAALGQPKSHTRQPSDCAVDYLATNNSFSSKSVDDVNMLGKCYNEEIISYQLHLEKTRQEIEKLEAEVGCNLDSVITEKLPVHNVRKKANWQKCNFGGDGDDDLATDGVECSVLKSGNRQSESEEYESKNMVRGDTLTCNANNTCEDIEQLKKNLGEMLMEECNDFKKEILSLLGQEIKKNISDKVCASALENTFEQKSPLVEEDRKRSNSHTGDQLLSKEEVGEASAPPLCEEVNYLNYGSVLAFSYFYGYLKLILPVHEFGTPPFGIKGKIEAYINAQHLSEDSFPLMKLIVLVPLTLDTPSDPQELSRDEHSAEGKYWIEPAKHRLEAEVIARAGVTKRSYDVPVYKIKDPDTIDKPKYIAATVALKSLFDVVNMNPADSSEIRQHLQEIILSFCRTLEIIIKESEDCRDLCEIICFTHKDSNGKRVNLAKVILERLDKLLTERNERLQSLHQHQHRNMRHHMV